MDPNTACILIFVVVFLLVYISIRKPAGIPPGSYLTLPVVGDLPLFAAGGVLETFRSLRKRHGDIFSFYMGRELAIVLNGYKVIQNAAVKKGQLFTGRPQNYLSNVTVAGKGIIFASGNFWKTQRRFIHNSLQDLGFGKSSYENKIIKEVRCFTDILNLQNGQPCDIKEFVNGAVANIIFAIVSGKRHEYDDPVFRRLLLNADVGGKLIMRVSVLLNCLPFLKHLPGDPLQMNTLKTNHTYYVNYLSSRYNEHRELGNNKEFDDLMGAFIQEINKSEESGIESDFTFEQLTIAAIDLFGAGSDTTSTALSWALLYLVHFPKIQRRLQKVVDNIIPRNRDPNLGDKEKLPYVEAFIMEVLRFSNIAPLAIPHATADNVEVIFEGYTVPRNSSIIFNLESVLFDPMIFAEPYEFKPERFLDCSGNVLRPKEFIPFGIGRRVCLGESLARMELFLFLTAIIKEFDILPEKEDNLPKLAGMLGITYTPYPYKLRAVKRVNKDIT